MCYKFIVIVIIVAIFGPKGSICEDVKLPTAIRPSKYHLKLKTSIHEENTTFLAEVEIFIKTFDDVQEIKLHSVDLNVDQSSVKVLTSDNEEVEGTYTVSYDTSNEVIQISTPKLLSDNSYILKMSYSGNFHSNFSGFYGGAPEPDEDDSDEISEHDEDVEVEPKSYFLSLSFQTVKFRYLCPSFDEMDIRTIFEIEVEHHESYRAISNSNQQEVIKSGTEGFKITKFHPTPSLPTTSIAVIICNFNSMSISGTYSIDIYAKDEFLDTSYLRMNVMDMALNITKLFNDHFREIYDIKSMKLVLLPHIAAEISAFGLIAFNQYHLTYHPYNMAMIHKDNAPRYLARTYAQQYFGNIASMSSKQETFIPVGFAIFYEFFMASKLKPDIMNVYSTEILQKALETDSFPYTKEMMAITDVRNLAGSKFTGLLKMTEEIIGTEKFNEDVVEFLKLYNLSTTTMSNFYDSFFGSTDEELKIKEFFRYWIDTPGYPVIDVSFEDESSKIILNQSRFTIFPENDESASQPWPIPLTYITSDNDEPEIIWLEEAEKEIDEIEEAGWILFNSNQNGFYRVNYDEITWNKLAGFLKTQNFGHIPVLNRAGLIDDVMNLAIAQKIPYEIVFNVISYLEHETELMPWKVASNGLKYIDVMLTTESQNYEKFKKFIVKLMEPIYKKLGTNLIDDESSFDRELRQIAIFWMCKMEENSCLNFINQKFDDFKLDPQSIAADIQYPILCSVIRTADYSTFINVLNITLNTSYRDVLLKALACTENEESISYISEKIYCKDKISSYDKQLMFNSFMGNSKFGLWFGTKIISVCYEFMDDSEIYFLIDSMVKKVWNNRYLGEFEEALNLLVTGIALPITQFDEYMRVARENLKWRELYEEEIGNWLNSNILDTTTPRPIEESTTTEDPTESPETTTPDKACSLKIGINLLILLTIVKLF